MIEGLWVINFITPNDPAADLNGGILVIESNKAFGGDSGYYYVGQLEPSSKNVWAAKVAINRHDPNIVSVFGDLDQLEIRGTLTRKDTDPRGRSVLLAEMAEVSSGAPLVAQLTKVAELP